MRPFNLLRACFLLLAAVVAVELLSSLVVLGGCFWMVVVTARYQIGACADIGSQIREVWAELLATILALLLAGRSQPPPGGHGGPGDT